MLISRYPESFAAAEARVDQALDTCANVSAVFVIWPREGKPYLGRTTMLRRRLKRLLGPREQSSRMLHLRALAERVDYWPFASRLESTLLLYALAIDYFPEDHERVLKLRQPAYIRLLGTNPFPRTMITTRLAGGESISFGPFRTRSAAEQFEAGFLDFYQLRRCQEDLNPSPEHPGCLYGEMNKCLRPCQQIVSREEYRSEVDRVATFLRSGGQALVASIQSARDRLSESLEFEEAARAHTRLEKAQVLVASRDPLAGDAARLCGVAVLPAVETAAVDLRFLIDGVWRASITISLHVDEGAPVSIDAKLKAAVTAIDPKTRTTVRERQDHLAILAAWFYSSWRDGEWIPFERLPSFPYRKVVNAIHRVAKATP